MQGQNCSWDNSVWTGGNSVWTRKKTTLFSDHYLRNRTTLNVGVLGYIGII